MGKLLPCPFCGSEADFYPSETQVYCTNIHCYCEGPFGYDREAAIAAWNRRTPPVPEGVPEVGTVEVDPDGRVWVEIFGGTVDEFSAIQPHKVPLAGRYTLHVRPAPSTDDGGTDE